MSRCGRFVLKRIAAAVLSISFGALQMCGAALSGEHRLLACSSRQLAANYRLAACAPQKESPTSLGMTMFFIAS
ncbi:MAG: hypothetical protein DME40_15670 [Verrucomicrobia bacterium]|nr:MAG: hypothetical protein DME40_15670 [Verrucomicrobiota bacterium]